MFRGNGQVKSLEDETSAHESLHALGLNHTFSNSNFFTMREKLTDNVLDYSFLSTNYIKLISSWRGHWKIVRKHPLLKGEEV